MEEYFGNQMSDLTHRENLSLGDISMNSFVSAIRKG
jgi:hypothetical protein